MKNSQSLSTKFSRVGAAKSAAFTLVEMLASITIFSILMLIFSQVILTASHEALSENAKMDSLSDARGALDRFALDWSARVRRPDTVISATTNSISFLSQVPSYSGTRLLAAVSYQVGTASTLQRGVLGYNWLPTDSTPDNNPTMIFPSSPVPPTIAPPSLASGDYESLSGDVFHMSISFLGPTGYSTDTSLVNSTNLAGIVVTVAALDQQNRKLIDTSKLTSLGSALDIGIATGTSPLSVWQNNINSPTFAATANVPKPVADAVRVYQRVFYTKE